MDFPKRNFYSSPLHCIIYFKVNYFGVNWITSDFGKAIIKDIDKSEVFSAHVVESPYLGAITPTELSGGVKTLLLMVKDYTDSNPEKKLFVIADGAAFGSEMNRFMEIYKSVKNPAVVAGLRV
ncbi:MAG: DUF4869 domain-containing protein [Treponema sp.]|nr:DUF4869 domain-containing protein [Treponema sp.]